MMEQETYLQKTLQLQNQQTGHIDRIKISFLYLPNIRHINLSKTINQLHQIMGIKIQNSHFFYFDAQRKMYVSIGVYPFPQEIFVKYQNFINPIVHLKYRKSIPDSPNPILNNSPKNRETAQSSKKTKERTISEVLDLVKVWRRLYQEIDQLGNKKHTLLSAAQVVGVSKKTLDDYFYQTKLAQKYKFDLEGHKNEKIGVMRQYIKEKQKQPQKVALQNNEFEQLSHTKSYYLSIPNFVDTDLFWVDFQKNDGKD